MEDEKTIQVGMSQEEVFVVEEEHAASRVGSGAYPVLATPWLVAFMERVSHRLVTENLPEGKSSVGVKVEVEHLAPIPVGREVRVSSLITRIDGKRVELEVLAWDGEEPVGSGSHTRVIVDDERFRQKIEAKRMGIKKP
jgi:predicted thioesterase